MVPGYRRLGDPFGVLRHAWANYRDESFVLQYLSPAMIRRFRLFHVSDDSTKPAFRVEAIHDDVGYRKIRSALSRQYDLSRREPDIQVVDVDLRGDRCLILAHYVHNGVLARGKELPRRNSPRGDVVGLFGQAARNRRRHRQDAEDLRGRAARLIAGPRSKSEDPRARERRRIAR